MNLEAPLIQLDAVSRADAKHSKPLFSAISPHSNNKIPFTVPVIPSAPNNLLVPDGGLKRRSASESEGLNLAIMEAARRMPADARAESLCSSPRINHYQRTTPTDPYAGMKSVTGAGLSASFTSGSMNALSLRPKMSRNQTIDTPTISKYEGEVSCIISMTACKPWQFFILCSSNAASRVSTYFSSHSSHLTLPLLSRNTIW